MTKEAFRKHFKAVTDDYGQVQIVDLLKDATKREERLTKEYYKQFYDSQYKAEGKLKFLHFDFHRFTKGDKFQPLRVLISQLDDQINNFGALIVDLQTGDIVQEQKGVFRVNCLDSIDRTNVAISQIAITVFQRQLELNQINLNDLLGIKVFSQGIAFSKIDHPLINNYKFLWREKSNFLSR